MLDEKLVPPAFIINAIPGADKLARAATAARAAIDKAGVKAREAGEAARATSTFHIGDPANRPPAASAEPTSTQRSTPTTPRGATSATQRRPTETRSASSTITSARA